jgi:hypothetical protein
MVRQRLRQGPHRARWACRAALLGVTLAALPAAADPLSLVSLGSLPGYIAGISGTGATGDRPYLWTPGSGMTAIGTLGGTGGGGRALSSRGTVLGYATNAQGLHTAFRTVDGTAQAGAGLAGTMASAATATPGNGSAAGDANGTGWGGFRLVLWDPSGAITNPGTWPADKTRRAYGMDANWLVVEESVTNSHLLQFPCLCLDPGRRQATSEAAAGRRL